MRRGNLIPTGGHERPTCCELLYGASMGGVMWQNATCARPGAWYSCEHRRPTLANLRNTAGWAAGSRTPMSLRLCRLSKLDSLHSTSVETGRKLNFVNSSGATSCTGLHNPRTVSCMHCSREKSRERDAFNNSITLTRTATRRTTRIPQHGHLQRGLRGSAPRS